MLVATTLGGGRRGVRRANPVLVSVRRLGLPDVVRIGDIDRSERVDTEYRVVDGRLTEHPATIPEIPNWDPIGTGEHSVRAQVAFCCNLIAAGAVFLGAVEGERSLGLAVVDCAFEPGMAWLAFLYVHRADRRRGVAHALWQSAVERAQASGAESIYVSAVPTASAVGFYLRHGCRLARPVHPTLFAHEPDDIHLVCRLG